MSTITTISINSNNVIRERSTNEIKIDDQVNALIEEFQAAALKIWYEAYWPQEDNQKAAELLVSSLIECRTNKENQQESSKACIAALQHVESFMTKKDVLALQIIMNLAVAKEPFKSMLELELNHLTIQREMLMGIVKDILDPERIFLRMNKHEATL